MHNPLDGKVNDLTKYIFGFFNAKELSKMSLVCKNWQFMSNDESLWSALLKKETDYENPQESKKITYLKFNALKKELEQNSDRSLIIMKKSLENVKIVLLTPYLRELTFSPWYDELGKPFDALAAILRDIVDQYGEEVKNIILSMPKLKESCQRYVGPDYVPHKRPRIVPQVY